MEESPWTCTRTPACAGSAVFRTAGFLFAQLSTAGDGLRTHCDLFTKQALVRTRNAGVSGDGVNRTRSVKCLQHPAFPLGYVAALVHAIGIEPTSNGLRIRRLSNSASHARGSGAWSRTKSSRGQNPSPSHLGFSRINWSGGASRTRNLRAPNAAV